MISCLVGVVAVFQAFGGYDWWVAMAWLGIALVFGIVANLIPVPQSQNDQLFMIAPAAAAETVVQWGANAIGSVDVTVMKKALASYLPTTRTEIVRLTSPINAPALRVWVDADYVRDYFVAQRSWWEVSADNTFHTPPTNLRVGADSGVQLLSAAIAGNIASWHRPTVFPLRSDMYTERRPLDTAVIDRANARLAEGYRFLVALSNGQIPFTDAADALASHLIQELDGEIRASRDESAAETA